jgi:hypothetical protein
MPESTTRTPKAAVFAGFIALSLASGVGAAGLTGGSMTGGSMTGGASGSAARAAAAGVFADPSLCARLPANRPFPNVEHRPRADVEYTPGIDVRGRPVAPADVPGSAATVRPTDHVEIPVTADMLAAMGIRAADPRLPGTTSMGTLVVDGNRILFNGQQISAMSEGQLRALCQSR